MRIALISFDFAEYCIRLANALGRKLEVALLLPDMHAEPHLPILDSAVKFQPFRKPRLRQVLQQVGMVSSLIKSVERFDPDVVHVQQGYMWFNFGLPWLQRYPLVMTVHDPRHHIGDKSSQKTPQLIMDFGFHRADQIIVHAKEMRKILIEGCHISSQRVHVIPHIKIGHDLAYGQQQEEEECLILFFGRIWEYKGLEYLIRAEPLITSRVPKARIVIAGQGEDFDRYRRMMVHPESFIVYNEYISDGALSDLFRRAAVVVLPYIEATQSGVIPLAYTFRKPVVATTVGGLPEMVEHGRTGYLVPPRNPLVLAKAIVRLLKDKQLRRQFGMNGHRKIDTECSPDAVAEKTLRVYYQTLADLNRAENCTVTRATGWQ